MITKVIFSGDPYRGDQAINIEKTARLFMPMLKQLGVSAEVFATDINKNRNRNEWVASWTTSLLAYPRPALAAVDLEGAAVVGFEMPDAELEYLSRRHVSWVNFCIHPIRFLDDLCFDVVSSFEYDINKIAVSSGAIDFCASRIMSSHVDDAAGKRKDTLLVCAQDWIDRSIFFDNDFKRLDSYIDKLDDLTKSYDRVLYKPHPSFESKEISALMAERYRAKLCDVSNIYDVFSTQDIKAICAISSSVLVEAPWFDIQSIYLEPRAKRYGPPVGYKALMDDVEFWTRGLLGREGASLKTDISSVVPANFLRKTFGSWSFVTDEIRLEQRLSGIESSTQRVVTHSQQAETKAQQAEAKAQQAEIKAQQAEAKAQQAEIKARQAEAKAQQAEAKAQQAEAKAQQAEAKAQQAESASSQHLTQLHAVYNSTSWRITAAPRWFVIQIHRLKSDGLRSRLKSLVKKVLRKIDQQLLVCPRLRQRLIGCCHRLGLYPKLKVFYRKLSGATDFTDAFARHDSAPTELQNLSPRAQQIYFQLKEAIARRQKGRG